MTDKFGVLGAASTITSGSLVTVYTVPSGKAARAWLQYIGQANAAGTSDLNVLINGQKIFAADNITASNYIFSSPAAMQEITSAYPTGVDSATTLAKGPYSYLLSEGDTVQYQIDDADFIAMDFQVVGAEVDIS